MAAAVLSLLQVLIVLLVVAPLLLIWVVAPAQIEVLPLMVPALGGSTTCTLVRTLDLQPLAVTRYITEWVSTAGVETKGMVKPVKGSVETTLFEDLFKASQTPPGTVEVKVMVAL